MNILQFFGYVVFVCWNVTRCRLSVTSYLTVEKIWEFKSKSSSINADNSPFLSAFSSLNLILRPTRCHLGFYLSLLSFYLQHVPFVFFTLWASTSLRIPFLVSVEYTGIFFFINAQHTIMSVFTLIAKVTMQWHCCVFSQVQDFIVLQFLSSLSASWGFITINLKACFPITSHNGCCMFGIYWLAIGSTCLYIK